MTNTATPPSSPMQLPATWDAVAAGYADVTSRHTEYAEEVLRIAAPAASARVLDVGTGPGILAFVAAPRVARVDAVDFSPGMIEQVHARCARDEHYFRILECSGAPLALLKKRLGEEAWAAASRRLFDAVSRRIPATGLELAAEAMLTSGTR